MKIRMSEYGQLELRYEITVGEDIPEGKIIKVFGSLEKFRAEMEEDSDFGKWGEFRETLNEYLVASERQEFDNFNGDIELSVIDDE